MSMVRIYKDKIISNVKSAIRLTLSIGLYYSGMVNLLRFISRRLQKDKGIKILAYHNIGNDTYLNLDMPEDIFKKQIEFLIQHNYNIVSLEEAAKLLKSKSPIPKDTFVITFDDGYRSIYTTVLPIVKQYGIPITVFLSTGPIESRLPLFVDAIAYAIENTSKKLLDLSSWNLREYSINSSILKEKALYEINKYSKGISTKDRKKLFEFIFEQLDVDFNSPELRNKILSWNEIVEMSKEGIVEFGVHTVSHPSLSRIPIDEARDEILRSKRMIQEKLKKEVKTFAYPYGSVEDVNEEVRNIVEQNGFLCACVLEEGINIGGDDLFLLKRCCITNLIKSRLLIPFSKAVFAVQMLGGLNVFYRKKIKKIKRGNKNAKKINILFLIDQLMGGAGTERYLANLVAHLNRDRFNSVICCFEGKDGTIQQEIRKQGVQFLNLNLNKIYSFKALVQIFTLAKIIRKNRIDIVQTYHFKSDTYGVLVSKLSGVSKIIPSRRDTGDLKKPRQVFLNKLTNRFVNHYIMVCNAVGKRVYKTEGVPQDKMTTIYNGVDLKRFDHNDANCSKTLRRGLNINEDDFVIGTTAIFRPEKAYHIFFEGIEQVVPVIKNLKVLALGFGVTKQHFEDYCNEKGLNDVVKFAGYVENVENYLPLMDIFCLVPNKNEGFSNAILEAMAMGRPVIATDVGGNAEAVVHNETGLIIPPDDSDRLSEAILDLYRDPAKGLDMGKKARKRVEERFSMEKMIRDYEKFYEEILTNS